MCTRSSTQHPSVERNKQHFGATAYKLQKCKERNEVQASRPFHFHAKAAVPTLAVALAIRAARAIQGTAARPPAHEPTACLDTYNILTAPARPQLRLVMDVKSAQKSNEPRTSSHSSPSTLLVCLLRPAFPHVAEFSQNFRTNLCLIIEVTDSARRKNRCALHAGCRVFETRQ